MALPMGSSCPNKALVNERKVSHATLFASAGQQACAEQSSEFTAAIKVRHCSSLLWAAAAQRKLCLVKAKSAMQLCVLVQGQTLSSLDQSHR